MRDSFITSCKVIEHKESGEDSYSRYVVETADSEDIFYECKLVVWYDDNLFIGQVGPRSVVVRWAHGL